VTTSEAKHDFEGGRAKFAIGASEKKIYTPVLTGRETVVCADPQHTMSFSMLMEVKTW